MFLMLPTLTAVAMSLRAGHALALSTSAHITVRPVAITALEVLLQYLLGPSGHVLMALLHFLEKLHQFLISSPLGILEILHTSLTAL
jgi:hypothetical protein